MQKKLTLTQRVIKALTPFAFPLVRVYWFVFRPHTYGAKVVLVHQGKVLLVRHTYGRKRWTLPGGGIHRGETPDRAAQREVSEELGIAVKINDLVELGSFVSQAEHKYDHVSAYCIEVSDDSFVKDEFEIGEAKWFALDELPETGSVAKRILKLYEQHRS